jgi:sulfate adenylyltransferase
MKRGAMDTNHFAEPHGGTLVNLLVDNDRQATLKELSINLPDIVLNDRQLCDFELIASGAFSPLTGYMNATDYESVIDRQRLQNDLLWPLPVCLDVSETMARSLEGGQSVAIRDPEGYMLAVMHVEDIWEPDLKKEAVALYGTTDQNHPDVNYLRTATGRYYVGGSLEVVSLPLHFDFKQLRLTPGEVRNIYRKLGWQRVVGFQTKHPIHRLQFEMTIRAMRQAKANLLVLPISGTAKAGDFDHYTRVRCYRKVAHNYPPDSYVLNLLPLDVRSASPRKELLQLIIAKNFGCTHAIVKHNGDMNYQETVGEFAGELSIELIPFQEMVYLPEEDDYKFTDQIDGAHRTISMSENDIHGRIRSGRKIPEWATFTDVTIELQKAYPPPRQQGVTVFLTGLSGAGKSTIAQVLYSRFLEIGDRPVTLLDGDIVRRNLSSELKFTKEHRDINVKRIGFVASEITKNRGIAICAPIAPYETTRGDIRKTIEAYGGFIEVHVATPIEVCEKRDRKGMYAKARAGLIKGFTGVDDPYEAPVDPEVKINTADLTPDEAAQEILLYLGQRGFI